MIARRALLAGMPAIAAASLAPAAVAAALSVDQFLATASPEDRAQYHAARLAEALGEIRPGGWFASVRPDEGFAAVVWQSPELMANGLSRVVVGVATEIE